MPGSRTRGDGRGISAIFLENCFSVFNLIILAITGFILYFYFTREDPRLLLDSFGMLLVAFLNTVIAIVQEIRAKVALDKVNMLLRRKVVAIRDGAEVEIEVEEVRPGDRLVLRRGDQAVADGRLERSDGLEMDESLLTGESVPIRKRPGEDEILSGSFAVAGSGILVAEKVGDDCHAAKVTRLARKRKFVLTPLQKRLNFLVKLLFATAVVLVGFEVTAEAIWPSDIPETDFVRKLATILISLVPQGLVLFSSVTFALGVFRISRIGAIIQKLNAIESFANVTTLCTDKTGTLTENRLVVQRLEPLQGTPRDLAEGLLGAFRAFSTEQNATIRAMEALVPLAGARKGDELPFSSQVKFSAMELWFGGPEEASRTGTYVLGGFDILLDRLSADTRAEAERIYREDGLSVYRCLLFSRLVTVGGERADGDAGRPLAALAADPASAVLAPICIVAISDTPRPDAKEALARFSGLGIDLKVLSGDASEAIAAVLRDLDWKVEPADMVTGARLDAMDDAALVRATAEKTVFSRLRPEHKLRLLKALRGRGRYVAMIGDGVNDLPAIKEADMGIAMEEGSAITREVSDIVLLKNRFSLLPAIFDEGNKIVNTVKSVARLFLTKNFLVIAMTLLALAFGLDFPLTPRRVSLLNLFGIGLPAVILAMRNANISRTRNFFGEVLGHVGLAAAIIVAASYAVAALAPRVGVVSEDQRQMAMLWVMLFLFIVNFVIIARDSGRRLGGFLAVASGLVGCLLVFSSVDWTFGPYAFVKTFYEIETVQASAWPLVAVACLVSGGLMVLLQWLRSDVLGKRRLREASPG